MKSRLFAMEGTLRPFRTKICEGWKNSKVGFHVFDLTELAIQVAIESAFLDFQAVAAEPGYHDRDRAIKSGKRLLIIYIGMRDVPSRV
jgi:hypothetical protein